MDESREPVSLPEITVKALILGILLSAALAGANAYLGLKAGMTVSASIPAAVISMGVLRLFRRSNILENNIVQTAASAGESLAAGVIFTLPALLILGTWTDFPYWQTTLIAALGGLLGVLFTVPLRRALIVETKLTFPEGIATAEVLEAGEKGGRGIRWIAWGAVVGGLFKFGETGLGLWTSVVQGARRVGGSVAYIGTNVAPALVGVGYIVGLRIAVLVFLGGALNWFVAIPIVAARDWPMKDGAPMSALEGAKALWETQTRYLGVGAMLVGGVWAVVRLWPMLWRGIASGLAAYRDLRREGTDSRPRTERDAPMQWVGLAIAVSVVPIYFVFRHATGDAGVSAVMALVMLVAGFLFSAVASYMAGLVGSSNNPISGVTIATILTSALLLLALGTGSTSGPAAAILIGGVVCCAAAIGGDNLQDLKTGHLVGATPWKQQVMQIVGVLAAAFIIAPVLTVLLKAYGMGPVTVAGQKPLDAPQATLMASVARGVFVRDLPWGLIGAGMGVAAAVIVLDLILERRGSAFRTPVMALAVGLYLPLALGTAIFAGGLVAWTAAKLAKGTPGQGGLLVAAGLITGEAVMGILLAIPIAANEGVNPIPKALGLTGEAMTWPGVIVLHVAFLLLLRSSRRGEGDAGA